MSGIHVYSEIFSDENHQTKDVKQTKDIDTKSYKSVRGLSIRSKSDHNVFVSKKSTINKLQRNGFDPKKLIINTKNTPSNTNKETPCLKEICMTDVSCKVEETPQAFVFKKPLPPKSKGELNRYPCPDTLSRSVNPADLLNEEIKQSFESDILFVRKMINDSEKQSLLSKSCEDEGFLSDFDEENEHQNISIDSEYNDSTSIEMELPYLSDDE